MSVTKAQEAKEKGNASFKAQNYPEAVGHYTAAILADGNDPTFPLNRAAAYLKLGKNYDAERDCSTVLHLSPGHVKALFRRAQARIGLGDFNEARGDLETALTNEPANAAIKSELQNVDRLIKEQKQSKSKSGRILGTKQSILRSEAESSTPIRRRIPIEVIEPNVADLDVSRSQPIIDSSTDKQTVLTGNFPKKGENINRTDIQQQKQPSAEISVRGGIFRPSGAHTLFQPRSPNSSDSNNQTAVLINDSGDKVKKSKDSGGGVQEKLISNTFNNIQAESLLLKTPPVTFYDFIRSWEQVKSPFDRWAILSRVPASSIPSLFKNALEAKLLVQILESLDAILNSDIPKESVNTYLHWISLVPRFGVVILFLSKSERELARRVLQATKNEDKGWRTILLA